MNDFSALEPNDVLTAMEVLGYDPTGRILQLNSYENRVYMLDLEPKDAGDKPESIVPKFYRPKRWSQAAIQEEHDFLQELLNNEIPVIAPIVHNKKTIHMHKEFFYSVFRKARGRLPQEFLGNDFKILGRTLAHIHNIGSQKPSKHRPVYSAEHLGRPALNLLQPWIRGEVKDRYNKAAELILDALEDVLDPKSFIRIHADFHRGNLLMDERVVDHTRFLIMDFDDFGMGPPVQDFWMITSDDDEMDQLLDGYQELRDFDEADLDLIPVLRGFRIIRYAAWIAQRWLDPSFPQLFPQFKDYNYWAEETEQLEKISWDLS